MSFTIEQLIERVTEIPTKTGYWFVRTNDGTYFDTFIKNNFIAIGWNNISATEVMDPGLKEKVRKKIIDIENFDITRKGTKRDVSNIYNKLRKFVELKSGDVVVIPSKNSSRLAFGIIESSQVYVETSHDDCNFQKRKRVKWLEIKNLNELDSKFYKIKFSRHTISQIDYYAPIIDKVISSLFVKNEKAHFVIDVKTDEEVNVQTLLRLMGNIQKLLSEVNQEFAFNESIENNVIRLNLQSPGLIEFILHHGKSLITLATILSIACCNPQQRTPMSSTPEIHTFIQKNIDTLDQVERDLVELKADRDRINSIANGH